jgi:hypothetical protein
MAAAVREDEVNAIATTMVGAADRVVMPKADRPEEIAVREEEEAAAGGTEEAVHTKGIVNVLVPKNSMATRVTRKKCPTKINFRLRGFVRRGLGEGGSYGGRVSEGGNSS